METVRTRHYQVGILDISGVVKTPRAGRAQFALREENDRTGWAANRAQAHKPSGPAAAILTEPEKKRKMNMEPLVFAIASLYKSYTKQDTIVPEPAEFRPFDLRALRRSYEAETNASSRPSDRQNSFLTQAAS